MSIQLRPIAYLAQTFPGLTGVYREVMALQGKGLKIHTFATWQTPVGKVSDEAKELIEQTFYIFPIHWFSFLKAHATYLLTKPLAYLGTLAFVLTRPNQPLATRWRILFHFAKGVYLAVEIEKRHIRHIHAHFANLAPTQALVVERLTGVPFSFTAHATGIFADQIILTEKIKAARFIVAISEYNKRFLVEYAGNSQVAEKIHVIHCGAPIADFSPGVYPNRASATSPLILSVGRLVEKKGFPFLIRACKRLRDRGYHARCVIVGSGPQEETLSRLIHELGMEDWIELPGWLDQTQIKAYLEEATIFTLPCVVAANGDRDGIPIALMEAMAMAKPCVSEIALADALSRLLDDPQLASRLGQTGREKVRREFNLDRVTDQLLHLFARELAGKTDSE
jgi:glycosyltransferase involved in cell wall biosynthesis